MSAWIPSPMASAARNSLRTTLDLLLDDRRRRRSLCYAAAAAIADDEITYSKAPRNDTFLARLSELVEHFPKRDAASLLASGARPRKSHPYHYNQLMKAFSRAGDADEVIRLLREMKESSDCPPNIHCYTTVVNSLVAANRPREAEAMFEEMILSGVTPDACSYTVLVKLYSCYLKQFDSAYEVIRWMVHAGSDPDVVTYSTLISGLCQAGRVEEAWGVLDQMLEGKCTPNSYCYTPILRVYCSDGRISAAKRLVDSMQNIGCPPDVVAYNILIYGLCRLGKFDEVNNVLKQSDRNGWKPDVVTFNTYINGLCRVGRSHEALEHLEAMIGRGVSPTRVTFSILLDCLCRELKFWDVRYLLQRCYELGLDVGVDGYNTVMSRLYKSGRWLSVPKLLADMVKNGIRANNQTINIVIQSLCKAGKLWKAKCMFQSKGFVADIVSYNILFYAFYVAGKIEEVHELFLKMDVMKVSPDTITCNIMVDRLCAEEKFSDAIYFIESLEDGFSPDLVAHLTYGLAMGGKLGAMLRLFEEMMGEGLVLDGRIFNSLIKAFCSKYYCQSKEFYKVCFLLDKMLGIA